MKKWMVRLASMLFLLALILSGCNTKPSDEPVPDEKQRLSQKYREATAALEQQEAFSVEITVDETMTVAGKSHVSSSLQTMVFQNMNSEDARVRISENVTYLLEDESMGFEYIQVFAGNKVYTEIERTNYRTNMMLEDFLSERIPAILVDEGLYDQITEEENVLHFSQPSKGEQWLVPEDASLLDASGEVRLTEDGQIADSAYTASYQYGPATYQVTVSAVVSQAEDVEIEVPEADAQKINTPEALLLIPRAYYRIQQANAITSVISSNIVSQAAGAVRGKSQAIDLYHADNQWLMQVDQDIFVVDYSQGSPQQVNSSLKEVFRDGVYVGTENHGEPKQDTSISQEDMYEYVMDTLLANAVQAEHFTQADITDLGDSYLLEFECDDETGSDFCGAICAELFRDEDFLDNLSSAYQTNQVEYYLAIDKATGFPTALGVNYSGAHTIDEKAYQLTMQLDQSIYLESLTAYETITDELLPEEEPENLATPVFYHVTGTRGQEMWLFGTIHVGDARTGFLPKEIYDAFDSADALAVEFDTQAFMEQAETDEKIQEMVSGAYYYTDGTTAKSHISDRKLYREAEQRMKASGNYNFNTPYMKPSLWNNALSNYAVQQGYALSAGQGMDMRLLKRAKAQGKPIRDIESAEFQIHMLTGFSDELQELLLKQSVSTSIADSQQSVQKLYEAWCAGNESVLQLMIRMESTLGMTEKEIALYEDYNDALLTQRNAGMFEVAKEYLESGETVFYAVGLAHLLTEDGLVNTLRQAGYTVELVTYASAEQAAA